MCWKVCTLALSFALAALGGCAKEGKEWMKVNQTYTTAEFRHDVVECTTGGDLDEACMRARGWVDITPSKPETPKQPENFRKPTPTGR